MTTINITMISGKVNYDNYKDNYDWWKGQPIRTTYFVLNCFFITKQ